MISLTDIDFRYPKSSFKLSIDKLVFPKGSKTAIIGPSGFGKTTLLNLISGIFIPQAGTVKVKNESINELEVEVDFSEVDPSLRENIIDDESQKSMVSVGQLSSNDNLDKSDFDSRNSKDSESKSNITGKASRFFRKASND